MVRLDFGRVYQRTFESHLFRLVMAYSQESARFHTYSPYDQIVIQKLMKSINA